MKSIDAIDSSSPSVHPSPITQNNQNLINSFDGNKKLERKVEIGYDCKSTDRMYSKKK